MGGSHHVAATTATFHLKHDEGGIIDIEFIVQYGVLAYAHQYPQLLIHTDNIHILDSLQASGLMANADAESLRHAYQVFRALEHRLILQNQTGQVACATLLEERQQVRRIWQQFIGLTARNMVL